MQQPRRGSNRESKEKEVAWRGGLGCDEVVRPMAQEASTEVMVVGVGCGRKKKKVTEERERLEREEREKVTVAALPLVRSEVDGNDGGKAGCGGGGRWQRKQKKKKKTGGAVERREKPTVALGGYAGFLWWSWYLWWCVGRVCWYYRRRRQLWKRWREKERKTERKLQKPGRR
jgi:hypothetical protein